MYFEIAKHSNKETQNQYCNIEYSKKNRYCIIDIRALILYFY